MIVTVGSVRGSDCCDGDGDGDDEDSNEYNLIFDLQYYVRDWGKRVSYEQVGYVISQTLIYMMPWIEDR